MTDKNAQSASSEAVHKIKNAQQAIEIAREAQLAEAVAQTAKQTREAVFSSLKEIFGEGDAKDPEQMKILVRRIPILCTNIETMHTDIASIKSNITWGVRLVLGGVLLAVLKVIFIS